MCLGSVTLRGPSGAAYLVAGAQRVCGGKHPPARTHGLGTRDARKVGECYEAVKRAGGVKHEGNMRQRARRGEMQRLVEG